MIYMNENSAAAIGSERKPEIGRVLSVHESNYKECREPEICRINKTALVITTASLSIRIFISCIHVNTKIFLKENGHISS